MWLTILIIALVVTGIAWFLRGPYSKTKAEFDRQAANYVSSLVPNESTVFTLTDIQKLPQPVQAYFRYSGFLNQPKMSYMKISFKDVDFVLAPQNKRLKMDYTQYNFADEPVRLAYIDAALYGIPFEGLDTYIGGHGGMKGVLGKGISLFNQRGNEMDRACLVTFLSESLILPSVALQPYVAWEPVHDPNQAKATITYGGLTASGIFTFSEEGELLAFTTEDRAMITPNGQSRQVSWSALFKDYQFINGMRLPTHLQAVWNEEQGDFIYFDSHQFAVSYR
ncbi:DUF6544 family protein [Paenibacillus sanguinis]|uniref:DUF6544 family protein n=1 Tax=Paenibacillus sanguinis TaxID=225906 RepID=UPI00036180DD|nr:DUF6544 family protein [Paenibacillus sanguinis]